MSTRRDTLNDTGAVHPMVLLRHDLPSGEWHYDWMLQPAAEAPLVAFRVDVRLDDAREIAPRRRFDAVRLPDHRAAYLEYQGPVGPALHGGQMGERGRVLRLAAGTCRIERLDADDADILFCFTGGRAARAVGRRESEAESGTGGGNAGKMCQRVWKFCLC
ncbi:MAG: hypothetical protein AB7G11_10855 [Phycisphaerales bacterium]